ncbi:MAG: HdeD family acid-resistance protein [Sphingomonas sp.]|jgi:uncharacterized membrane protein HdeD (DUF308 family)|uniref:HdeD family acid-resistance protein n=1 Tax=Sphingomonas sp. TaxID=28214 RepID=UPI003564945D
MSLEINDLDRLGRHFLEAEMSDTVFGSTRPTGHVSTGWLLAYGVLSIAVGVAAFVWPVTATFTAALLAGCFLIATGAVAVVASFGLRGHHFSAYTLLYGILSLVIGAWIAFEPLTGALSLTLMIAIWLSARGVMEIAIGARFRRFGISLVLLGIVNVLLAIWIIWSMPLTALTLPGYVLGISFLFSGVTAVLQATGAQR